MSDASQLTIASWGATFPKVLADIGGRNRFKALEKIVGLQLLPQLAANALRIEALIQLLTIFAAGSKQTGRGDIVRWIDRDLGSTLLAAWEDPPEDVFISNVVTAIGNSRIFEGLWESNNFVNTLFYPPDQRTRM